jgi:uncharacterized protein (TIGR00255 family)
MKSMTGFGRAEASNGNLTLVVEMKSVNNRFRDVQVRLPREYNVLEPRAQNLLRESVHRGRVDVMVRRSSSEGASRIVPDLALVDQYRKAVAEVANRLQVDAIAPLDFILAQPGVLMTADADPDALAEWDLLETALLAAAEDLDRMRSTEGEALRIDLDRHLTEALRLHAEIASHAEGIAERLRARLEERLLRLLADRLDPNRLTQEAAMLADKADIAEELSRFNSHCDQFAEALNAAEPVGRRLDFLLQEMNREVNTIGSKAAEHAVSTRVVDLKTTLERLREQAQNVE